MADHDARPSTPDPDGPSTRGGANPKDPGWYPDRASPTDQSYWDGEAWTARRRWTAGAWLVVGDAPTESAAESPPPGARYSANPSVPARRARAKSTGFSLNLGVFVLLVCGVALMYGSVGEWIHVSGSLDVAHFRVSVNGIDPSISNLISVNGWVTFIGGILLVVFACFQMASDELQPAIFTAVISGIVAIFAIYDMFRIVQKISQVPASLGADVSVGWGLICVLSAAVLAMLISLVRLTQR